MPSDYLLPPTELQVIIQKQLADIPYSATTDSDQLIANCFQVAIILWLKTASNQKLIESLDIEQQKPEQIATLILSNQEYKNTFMPILGNTVPVVAAQYLSQQVAQLQDDLELAESLEEKQILTKQLHALYQWQITQLKKIS
jgi:hypothetical protein